MKVHDIAIRRRLPHAPNAQTAKWILLSRSHLESFLCRNLQFHTRPQSCIVNQQSVMGGGTRNQHILAAQQIVDGASLRQRREIELSQECIHTAWCTTEK